MFVTQIVCRTYLVRQRNHTCTYIIYIYVRAHIQYYSIYNEADKDTSGSYRKFYKHIYPTTRGISYMRNAILKQRGSYKCKYDNGKHEV